MPMITSRRERREIQAYRQEQRAHQEALAVQRRLVLDLQQALQPSDWSALEKCGIQVSVRCHGADPQLRVGGDWYLSMPLPDGTLLLAVGDVAGQGLPAAASMVRLRCAMAAFAAECSEPAKILARLNTFLCRENAQSDAVTATSVTVRYSPATGEITWAQAGHMPPLAADWHSAWSLRKPDGLMLGVSPAAAYEQVTAILKPHSFVVLYTDGVFKREALTDEGVADFAFRVSAARHSPASLLNLIDYESSHDDACVLIAERVR